MKHVYLYVNTQIFAWVMYVQVAEQPRFWSAYNLVGCVMDSEFNL